MSVLLLHEWTVPIILSNFEIAVCHCNDVRSNLNQLQMIIV